MHTSPHAPHISTTGSYLCHTSPHAHHISQLLVHTCVISVVRGMNYLTVSQIQTESHNLCVSNDDATGFYTSVCPQVLGLKILCYARSHVDERWCRSMNTCCSVGTSSPLVCSTLLCIDCLVEQHLLFQIGLETHTPISETPPNCRDR